MMHPGLTTTFQLLAKTENEAAIPVLMSALDAPREEIRNEAMRTLLRRRGVTGGHEILRRFHALTETQKAVICENPGRITRALRDALVGTDAEVFRTACQAAICFREYDLAPTLLTVAEEADPATANLALDTLVKLTSMLYDELAAPQERAGRRDPQTLRRSMLSALETSLQRFGKHKRREVLECFLWLANRDNLILKSILQSPHHAAFLVAVDILSKSQHGGIMRLLLGFLDDPRAISAALSTAANRCDLKFVRHLLRKVGREPSATVAQNLKKIESIPWLRNKATICDQLDDAGQHAVVRLVMEANIPRPQAFETVTYLLTHGNAGGRREAARALAEFSGADANALALRALDDDDPQVQANILLQIRHRGIPGILPKLVEMVDSRHPLVRQAARQSLSEFTFTRFVGAFDMLDEEVRRSTGLLVKKVDPHSLPLLKKELESAVRTRRLRGVQMAIAMDLVEPLEKTLSDLLQDEDHLVRTAAVKALSQCVSDASREALTDALGDRSTMVQEAARCSLEDRDEFSRWREVLADPRD